MTKTLKIAALLFTSLVIFGSSCKKYEDGPSLSLRTKKARLANTWELTEATDGNVDISAFMTGLEMTIEKDGNYSKGGTIANGTTINEIGTWEFSEDKTTLILSPNGSLFPVKWIITRLKNDELWLKRSQSAGTEASEKYKGIN